MSVYPDDRPPESRTLAVIDAWERARTHLTHAGQAHYHSTPLTPLQERIPSLLPVPAGVYARQGTAVPQPLLNVRA